MKEQLRSLLQTEAQLVCLFQLVGPFLSRLSVDIVRKVFDVTLELYHALAKVWNILLSFMFSVRYFIDIISIFQFVRFFRITDRSIFSNSNFIDHPPPHFLSRRICFPRNPVTGYNFLHIPAIALLSELLAVKVNFKIEKNINIERENFILIHLR